LECIGYVGHSGSGRNIDNLFFLQRAGSFNLLFAVDVRATDTDWSWGSGEAVRADSGALVSLLGGRTLPDGRRRSRPTRTCIYGEAWRMRMRESSGRPSKRCRRPKGRL